MCMPSLYYTLQDFAFCRQGEEWHRFRSLLSKKMLRPKEIEQYNPQLNAVTSDFVQRLDSIRMTDNKVYGLEMEIFKWAMESKIFNTTVFEFSH